MNDLDLTKTNGTRISLIHHRSNEVQRDVHGVYPHTVRTADARVLFEDPPTLTVRERDTYYLVVGSDSGEYECYGAGERSDGMYYVDLRSYW